jgi:lipoate-protein ligase A
MAGAAANGIVKVITTTCTNPFLNIAYEMHLFKTLAHPTLYLWRNADCVIIGRHQNPWKECHLDRMEADGV